MGPERLAAALRSEAALAGFLDHHQLPQATASIALYLTWLSSQPDSTGPRVRRELQLLDLARRCAGEQPWSTSPDIQCYLRGLHRQQALGHGHPRCDPLYLGLVHACIDATHQDTPQTARLIAAVLIRNETGLPASVIARLTWHEVWLAHTHVTISATVKVGRGRPREKMYEISARPGDPGCLVKTLRELRDASVGNKLVVSRRGGPADHQRILDATAALITRTRGPKAGRRHTRLLSGRQLSAVLDKLRSPAPILLRDRALLLVGHGAALRTHEAAHLRIGDLRTVPSGLLLTVPGRPRPTAVPNHADPRYDATTCLSRWTEVMTTQLTDPDAPAFPQVSGSRIWNKPLDASGLNYAISRRCREAQLDGHYTFTSLRVGMIRDALRTSARHHLIAAHADLTSLHSIERHRQRELLVEDSVAGSLGL